MDSNWVAEILAVLRYLYLLVDGTRDNLQVVVCMLEDCMLVENYEMDCEMVMGSVGKA